MEKVPKSIHAAYKTHEGFTGVQPQPEAEALCCLPCSHLLFRSPHHHHITAEELSAQEEPSCPYRQPPAVHIHPREVQEQQHGAGTPIHPGSYPATRPW